MILVEDEVDGGKAVGTVRGDNRYIGVSHISRGPGPDAVPASIEFEPPSRNIVEIAHVRVIGNVAFVKHDIVPHSDQRLAQAAPKRRVAITPGRTDRQTEDHDFHAVTSPFTQETRARGPSKAIVLTLAGSIAIE